MTTTSSTSAAPAVTYRTVFGSLADYVKGGVEVINDDPRHYAFSNVFEVAAQSGPYERVAVGKNMEYVLEAVRAEGQSPWFTAGHDETALVMDGEVTVHLVKLDASPVADGVDGAVRLPGEPAGRPMGRVVARRGHLVLLPRGAAYRFEADRPGVLVLQTIAGGLTEFRWAEITQSA